MKFFDDINIEKLNSLLKFKTRDNNFKIKGSVELYTMKNTIKEKKTIVKKINDFLDEKYKETYINNELLKQQENSENGDKLDLENRISEDKEFEKMFYEQKRRLSVTSDFYNNTSMNGNITNNDDIPESEQENGKARPSINGRRASSAGSPTFPTKRRSSSSSSFSMKLNDEKLNKIINDTEYFMKLRQQHPGVKRRKSSSGTGPTIIDNAQTIEKESINDFDFQMGPFGNITDPQARKLFSQIVMIFNSSFQDHDFIKIISPLDFKEVPTEQWRAEFDNIINTDSSNVFGSNNNKESVDLASKQSERRDNDAFVPPTTEKLSGLNTSDVWKVLNNKIDFDSCYKILEFVPDTQDNIEEQDQYVKDMNKGNSLELINQNVLANSNIGNLEEDIKLDHPQINKKDFLKDELDNKDGAYVWSKLWFLINKKLKRVAFIYIICSRSASDESDDSEADDYYLDDEDAVVVTSDDEEYGEKGTELVDPENREDFDDDYDDDLEYAVESDDESE